MGPTDRIILFPTDTSDRVHRAAPLLVALAQKNGARVVVLHDLPEDKAPEIESRANDEVNAAALAKVQAGIDSLLEALAAQEVEVSVAVTYHGDPSEAIRHYADGEDVDLVFLVGHRKSSITDRLFGSTVYDLIDQCPCDVLVTTPEQGATAEAPAHALVPVNFRPESEVSIRAAGRWLAAGDTVHLLYVVPPTFPAFHGARGEERDHYSEEDMRANWRPEVEDFWRQHGRQDLETTVDRRGGRWGEAILEQAREGRCDLIVAGETERGFLRGLAERLAGEPEVCPVLIARV